MKIETNAGPLDRSLRVAAGVVLVVLAAMGLVGPWGWIGLVPLLTGWFGFCPAYRLLGISTCAPRPDRPR